MDPIKAYAAAVGSLQNIETQRKLYSRESQEQHHEHDEHEEHHEHDEDDEHDEHHEHQSPEYDAANPIKVKVFLNSNKEPEMDNLMKLAATGIKPKDDVEEPVDHPYSMPRRNETINSLGTHNSKNTSSGTISQFVASIISGFSYSRTLCILTPINTSFRALFSGQFLSLHSFNSNALSNLPMNNSKKASSGRISQFVASIISDVSYSRTL